MAGGDDQEDSASGSEERITKAVLEAVSKMNQQNMADMFQSFQSQLIGQMRLDRIPLMNLRMRLIKRMLQIRRIFRKQIMSGEQVGKDYIQIISR